MYKKGSDIRGDRAESGVHHLHPICHSYTKTFGQILRYQGACKPILYSLLGSEFRKRRLTAVTEGDRQTDGLTDRHTARQTGRQAGRQAGR